jgi:hypothetical protein
VVNKFWGFKVGGDIGCWRINTQSIKEVPNSYDNEYVGVVKNNIAILGANVKFFAGYKKYFVSANIKSLFGVNIESDMYIYDYKESSFIGAIKNVVNEGAEPKIRFSAIPSWGIGLTFIL